MTTPEEEYWKRMASDNARINQDMQRNQQNQRAIEPPNAMDPRLSNVQPSLHDLARRVAELEQGLREKTIDVPALEEAVGRSVKSVMDVFGAIPKIEELAERVRVLENSVVWAEAFQRIKKLEDGALGAKGDVVVEFNQQIRELTQRVTEVRALALGAQDRVGELESRYSPAAQEQDHAWARKVDEKLETLEAQSRRTEELREAADRVIRRVIPIEQKVEQWDKTLRGLDIFPYLEQREREVRWLDTYNHALQGLLASEKFSRAEWDDKNPLDAVAKMWADRAHGPLEAPPARKLDATIRKHVASEIEKETANVEALVKAARRAYDVTDADTTLWAELRNALKPFEREGCE